MELWFSPALLYPEELLGDLRTDRGWGRGTRCHVALITATSIRLLHTRRHTLRKAKTCLMSSPFQGFIEN